jgi:hypothetical protein
MTSQTIPNKVYLGVSNLPPLSAIITDPLYLSDIHPFDLYLIAPWRRPYRPISPLGLLQVRIMLYW